MIRAAAKNHAARRGPDRPRRLRRPDRARSRAGGTTRALPPPAGRARRSPAPPPTTPPSPPGLGREAGERFPDRLAARRHGCAQTLRYGENPHQQAAFYVTGTRGPGLATAPAVQGKELSYNNLADPDAALALRRPSSTRPGRRHHQAHQPLRRRRRPTTSPRPTTWPAPATRLSAFGGIVALQPPGRRRGGPAPSPSSSSRSSSPRRRRGRARRLRRQAEPAPARCSTACPTRAAPAASCAPSPAASWSRTATPAALDRVRAAHGHDARAPTEAELADLALRLAVVRARQVERDRAGAATVPPSASAPAR